MDGWIKIHRKLLDWEWYDDGNVVRVFLHLLLTANFEPKNWHGITIERGQVATSVLNLANQVHLSPKQVRTALEKLKNTNEIDTQTANKYTLITVCKYDNYQSLESSDGQTNGKQMANEGQTNGNQRATTKEIKNIKNEKNDNNILGGKTKQMEQVFQNGTNGTDNDNEYDSDNDNVNNNNNPLTPLRGETVKQPKFNPESVLENEPAEKRELLMRWINYKKMQFRQTYKSDDSFKTFVKKLERLSGGNLETAKAIIEHSIANTYQGIFELKKSAPARRIDTSERDNRNLDGLW